LLNILRTDIEIVRSGVRPSSQCIRYVVLKRRLPITLLLHCKLWLCVGLGLVMSLAVINARA